MAAPRTPAKPAAGDRLASTLEVASRPAPDLTAGVGDGGSGLPQVAKVVSAIVAPTTFVTALLFYFGQLHAYWFFRYLGVHSSVLELGTRDYLVRSVDGLFLPVAVLASAALPLVWGHTQLRRRLTAGSPPRWLPPLLAGLGTIGTVLAANGLARSVSPLVHRGLLRAIEAQLLAVLAGACVGLVMAVVATGYGRITRAGQGGPGVVPWVARVAWAGAVFCGLSAALVFAVWAGLPGGGAQRPPAGATAMGLALGVGLLASMTHLRRVRAHQEGTVMTASRWSAVAEWAVLFALVGVSLFWAAGDYSAAVGRGRAFKLVHQDLAGYPDAVVFSERPLSLSAPGVREVRCGADEAAYGFRYDGLKLILQSGGLYFLLSPEWSEREGSAVLLPRSDSLRLEFTPPEAADHSPSC